MRKPIVVVALVGLVGLGVWLATQGNPATSRTARKTRVASESSSKAAAGAKSSGRATPAATSSGEKDRRDRDLMRERILDAMRARARTKPSESPTGSGPTTEPPDRELPGSADAGEPEYPAGDLTDRTGNHGYLLKVLNEDLMPLVDECYDLARVQNPHLQGMLMMDIELIGDEDIGGVVESAQPSEDNEVKDPTLAECVRESILATTLPPPPEGGKDALMLSMRLSPDEEPAP